MRMKECCGHLLTPSANNIIRPANIISYRWTNQMSGRMQTMELIKRELCAVSEMKGNRS